MANRTYIQRAGLKSLFHSLLQMSHAYELLAEGGADSSPREVPERPMLVRLYPNTLRQRGACERDGIATEAIVDAGEQLLAYGSIDYFAVYRYRLEWHSLASPAAHLDWDDVIGSFTEFLQEESGAGENLYEYRGVHQLVHGEATGCDEDAGGYAPNGAGAEFSKTTAFGGGAVAWSPVCSTDSLTKNATIQEAVHCLLHYDTYSESLTGNGDDEHTLGRVRDRQTSPMLTYHWDDAIDKFGGLCPSTSDWASGHSQRLTPCTKEAVAQTAAVKADWRPDSSRRLEANGSLETDGRQG